MTTSLDRLRDRYDVVVAEGSGSPAEMNLCDRDVANMRFALYADAGVVPFVRDIDLPEDDAASLDRPGRSVDRGRPTVRIAVIRLPHLSNFDDFGPLERLPGVSVTYVDRPKDVLGANLVVLPGSKSTIADLRFIRERGLADVILAVRAKGTPIIGICGGFQMLGRWIDDPDQVESTDGGAAGLGLLAHSTVFGLEKVTHCRSSSNAASSRCRKGQHRNHGPDRDRRQHTWLHDLVGRGTRHAIRKIGGHDPIGHRGGRGVWLLLRR